MGVHGLWKIVEPAHRPVKLETLARKRLAVDASIWIYQFLKAVRDKEGNALRNSHIVGFFRRICKLLFHGIRPVFVFDGGAPALKRQTIAGRKQRREGRREDAARTAEKLLTLQVKRMAEEEAERRKQRHNEPTLDEAAFVYVDELDQTPQQRRANRAYKKTDQYQLPEMEYDLNNLGRPSDPRIMSAEELQEYAQQFEGMEDINLYDFSNVDFGSSFFQSLPDTDRYRILNAARLKSRLRMGYSKEQLDNMFPDRMAFSRFQVERVVRRNELSQRLMNIQGRNEDGKSVLDVARVAGERGREYALMRNDAEHGGWTMSFVGNKEAEGSKSKPIAVDASQKPKDEAEDEWDDDEDEEFEDVPIEGLNRLPKISPQNEAAATAKLLGLDGTHGSRRKLYESRRKQFGAREIKSKDQPNPLFLGVDEDDEWEDAGLAETDENRSLLEDEAYQRAIEASLGHSPIPAAQDEDPELAHAIELSRQEMSNDRPVQGKGKEKETSGPLESAGSGRPPASQEEQDIQRAVAESKKMFQFLDRNRGNAGESSGSALPNPIASLDLSKSASSLFGRSARLQAPSKPDTPEVSGMNEKADQRKNNDDEAKTSAPLPPWFSHPEQRDIRQEVSQARATIKEPAQGPRHELQVTKTPPPVETIRIQSDSPNPTPVPKTINARVHNDLGITAPISQPGQSTGTQKENESDEDFFEWEASDNEDIENAEPSSSAVPSATQQREPTPQPPRSPSPAESEEIPDDFDVAEVQAAAEEVGEESLHLDEDEEQELLQQMEREAQEHDRFAAELNANPTNEPQISKELPQYEADLKALRNQQKKDRRDADEVTQVMIEECQSLLKLFGLPYITAPMEAEAQCAELVRLNLVDGIVTDDSDVFLFGGTRVYRYMFNDRQTVQCYLASDLEKEFALDQRNLIAAAHLLGSDYTEGIPNVGPVTAIELIAEFATAGGLPAFKEWWKRVQQGTDDQAESQSAFRKKFRRNAAKIFLPPSFPDPRVDEAYVHAEVDSDPSAFEWGVPDLEGLRHFLMANIGWSQERTDEVLVPVIKDMNRKQVEGAQTNITQFFEGATGAGAFAPRVRAAGTSKRMERALGTLAVQGKRARGERVAEWEGELAGEQAEPVSMRDAVRRKARATGNAGRKKKGTAATVEDGSNAESPNEDGMDEDGADGPVSIRDSLKRKATSDPRREETPKTKAPRGRRKGAGTAARRGKKSKT